MTELDLERSWSYALDLLSRRAYTVAELRERLARRQAPERVVEAVVRRLEHYRLVDDEAYAEAFVRSRRTGKGTLRLRWELGRKGIAEEIAERTLAPIDGAAETAAAEALLRRNAWRFSGGDYRRNRARAFAFLARRGFPGEVAAEALRLSEWLAAGQGPQGQTPDGES